ncbi:L,D-transpeptidase [Paludibaculum fermentans]|uniref:L,D-transpeptidase n=1 Tax=Paludibaculum fermentans TaxID=1473598 RepID=UPI003EC03978
MEHKEYGHGQFSRLLAVVMLAAAQSRAAENANTAQRIVVSIPDRKLALVEDGVVVKIYDVAVGKTTTPSPTGTFEIVNRIPNPTWYGPTKVVGPGKTNPVGTRWMGLSVKGYGIHGTNRPDSIGKAASKGCIRMRNEDVEELFELVHVGATVELSVETSELFQPKGDHLNVVAQVPLDGDRSIVAAGGGDHPRP